MQFDKEREVKSYMKKIPIIIAILCIVFLLSGCSQNTEKRVISAKVRYFDGTCDTLLLTNYVIGSNGGVVTLFTDEGRTVKLSQNNVIIIEESEDQYNAKWEEDIP